MTRNEQVLQDALLENGISLTVGQIRTLDAYHRTENTEGEVAKQAWNNWVPNTGYPWETLEPTNRETLQAKEREKFNGWYRRYHWGIGRVDMDPVMARCLLNFLSSRLSKGTIPHPDVVTKVLAGETPTPQCGYLGCNMEYEEHTH